MVGCVYSVLPPPWTAEARWTAAVLAGGTGAMLFGETLLEVFGLEAPSALRPVDVLTPASARPIDKAFVHFVRSRHPRAAGRGVRERLARQLAPDIAVAAPPLLIAHLATTYLREEVRATLATLVQKRLTTVTEVTEWATAHSRVPGARVAEWAAAELAGGQQSEGEVRLHALARSLGMAPDVAQVKIWQGRRLVSITDAFWEIGVAGYFDGAVHMQHAVHQRDIAIRERLRTAGLVVCEATNETLGSRGLFGRTLAARLEQARTLPGPRRWARSARGIELDAGF